jgi:putative oxidoreductase
MPSDFTPDRSRLLMPWLAPFYAGLADLSWLLLRLIAGVALAVHGWPKIQDPFKNVGMVESLGFVPGVLWSPLLAGTEFFGGILIAIGLFTRPAAIGATMVLCVAAYFHWVVQGQGFAGAEKALLWAAITFFLAARGGGFLSVDRMMRKEF